MASGDGSNGGDASAYSLGEGSSGKASSVGAQGFMAQVDGDTPACPMSSTCPSGFGRPRPVALPVSSSHRPLPTLHPVQPSVAAASLSKKDP